MSVDPDLFRSVLGRFASGITIVTVRDADGADHGVTISAFCSVSLSPPLVLLSVGRDALAYEHLAAGEFLGVSILSVAQEALSRRFADPDAAHFDGVGYTRGERGVALLDDALAHLECRVMQRHPAGDHTLLVGELERAAVFDDRPLLYYRGGYTQLER